MLCPHISNAQNMDGLQQKLISIRAKPTATEMVIDKAQTPTSIVIENSDGSKTQIITTTEPQQSTEGMPADDIQDVPVDLPTDPSADPTSEPIQEELAEADPTDVQPTEKPVSKPGNLKRNYNLFSIRVYKLKTEIAFIG